MGTSKYHTYQAASFNKGSNLCLFILLTSYSTSQWITATVRRRIMGWLLLIVGMDVEGSGRGLVLCNIAVLAWRDVENQSLWIFPVPITIRNGHLQNTCQTYYCLHLKCSVRVNPLKTNGSLLYLTFRHRASSILGQAFHYSPENAFYIFNQQIYFIIWYLLDRASLI